MIALTVVLAWAALAVLAFAALSRAAVAARHGELEIELGAIEGQAVGGIRVEAFDRALDAGGVRPPWSEERPLTARRRRPAHRTRAAGHASLGSGLGSGFGAAGSASAVSVWQ
jgi:hypothetical protein